MFLNHSKNLPGLPRRILDVVGGILGEILTRLIHVLVVNGNGHVLVCYSNEGSQQSTLRCQRQNNYRPPVKSRAKEEGASSVGLYFVATSFAPRITRNGN